MAEWKKVVVSGSSVAQLVNDANYLAEGGSGATLSGSFNGSFTGDGSNLTNVAASSIAFGNITGKPTLVSSSAQITATSTASTIKFKTISTTTTTTTTNRKFAARAKPF